MPRWWAKVDCEIRMHPKVRAAGFVGGSIFIELLLINGAHEFDGEIPSIYCEAPYVADRLKCSEKEAAQGLAAIIKRGLVAHSPDRDSYTIIGWDDEWRPHAISSTERSRRSRERKKRESQGQRDETLQSVAGGDEMQRGGTKCNGATTPDQIRSDQNREDQITTSQVRRSRRPVGPDAEAIAQYLYDAILTHKPDFAITEAKLTGWARDVDLALRIDSRTPDQLRDAIDWAHRNPEGAFWRGNILSGRKLREKYDTLEIQARRPQREQGVTGDDLREVIAMFDGGTE